MLVEPGRLFAFIFADLGQQVVELALVFVGQVAIFGLGKRNDCLGGGVLVCDGFTTGQGVALGPQVLSGC